MVEILFFFEYMQSNRWKASINNSEMQNNDKSSMGAVKQSVYIRLSIRKAFPFPYEDEGGKSE